MLNRLSRWPTLRRAFSLTQNNIDPHSFVYEYKETHYPNLHTEEFQKLYSNTDRTLWKGSASIQGGELFASKNTNILPEHFRKSTDGRILHTSLSFGTYNKEIDKATYQMMFNSLLDSIFNRSINTIDTAPFWGYQRSQRTVGAALSKALLDKQVFREELFLASRVGYLDEDIDKATDAAARKTALASKKVQTSDFHGANCLHPLFIKDQVESSRQNLGVETLDLVYLHNPENWLPHLSQADLHIKIQVGYLSPRKPSKLWSLFALNRRLSTMESAVGKVLEMVS
jgi:diketogulonate reductase-like aldo/keto reductase